MGLSGSELLQSVSNQRLHLILLPTEACNFRCVYCYEQFQYKRMEPDVVRGVKNLISRRAANLRALTLSWFGGEPLLARGVMEDILLHARSLAGKNPRLTLDSDITTNGYLLTRPVLERLVELGVLHYQVTFDGPRQWHDRKRLRADGRGTFDRIWGNLLAARDVEGEFTVMVRLHVDRENAADLEEFLDSFRSAFGGDPRFELFIRGVSRLGGPNDATLPVLDRDEGPRLIEDRRARARGMGLKLTPARGTDSICYAARANSFVVRANGRLNKCTVALEHPNNQVGRLNEDGTVQLDPARMTMWIRGLETGEADALHCPMRGYADTKPPALGASHEEGQWHPLALASP